MTVGLVAVLVSVLVETEDRLSLTVMLTSNGKLVQLTALRAVVYESQSVAVVSHRDLGMATPVVVDGDTDEAGPLEDEVMWATQEHVTVEDAVSRTTAVHHYIDDTLDIIITTTDDDDDGIHRQVAVVQAANLPWWVS